MNIVVAEDEPLALDDVLAMLQPFAGSHLVSGFRSGQEVIEFTRSTDVDILITDVRMPRMDGLELLQGLRERGDQFTAIVLSGHSEFEYARTGIRLGVVDYLLKPVKANVLRQTVERALLTQADAQARRAQAREERLAQLLTGRTGAAPASLLSRRWGLIVTVCENWDSPTTWQATSVDRAFLHRTLADQRPDSCEIVELDGQRRVILVPPGRAQLPQIETLALLVHQAIVAAGVTVHTAYDCQRGDEEPALALRRVLERLARAMRLGAPTFVRPEGSPSKTAASAPSESRQFLAQCLSRDTLKAAPTEIHAALNRLRRQGACQPLVVQTLAELFDVLRQHIDRAEADFLPAPDTIAARVRACRTYDELAAWVDAQMEPLLSRAGGTVTPRDLVERLAELIRTAYWEDISIQTFAAEHGVSLAYFSRLFKDQTGMNFSDYQIQVRMAKAKELLARPDLRLADVSALIGYGSPNYFGQLFRRVFGVAPLDYQRSLQQDGRSGAARR